MAFGHGGTKPEPLTVLSFLTDCQTNDPTVNPYHFRCRLGTFLGQFDLVEDEPTGTCGKGHEFRVGFRENSLGPSGVLPASGQVGWWLRWGDDLDPPGQ